MKYLLKTIVCFLFLTINCHATDYEQKWFVDGYHGGIYGHYPDGFTEYVVNLLEKHPSWKICLEIEPETWDSLKKKHSEVYARFASYAVGNNVEFTNPTYSQPYLFNIDGESMIRHFQYGMKKISNHFPNVKFSTYAVEEPCFTACLPMVLRLLGFQSMVLKNPDTCWGGYTEAFGGEMLQVVGPDGTKITTVPRYACEKLAKGSTWQTEAWNMSDEYITSCKKAGIKEPVGMCFQDAGWENGPWLGIEEGKKRGVDYILWRDYFKKHKGKLQEWRWNEEDIHVALMWGTQTLQRIAQSVRKTEIKLAQTEKLATIAAIRCHFLPDSLKMNEAWRNLMLAQHHDSWIVPLNGLYPWGTWEKAITEHWTPTAYKLANDVEQQAMDCFGNNGVRFLRLFNTLGEERHEVVSISLPNEYSSTEISLVHSKKGRIPYVREGLVITFEASVPALGYTTYRIERGKASEKSTQKEDVSNKDQFVMENDRQRLVFDLRKGCVITQWLKNGKDWAPKCSEYCLGELRGYFYDEHCFHSSTEQPARILHYQNNGLVQTATIEGSIAGTPFYKTISLRKGSERVDVELTIKWTEKRLIGEGSTSDWRANRRYFYDTRYMLQLLLPFGNGQSEIYKDAAFNVCKSKLSNTFFNRWDSLKNNVLLHWVEAENRDKDLSLALLSDHTTSYSHGDGNPLGLTLQYSGQGLWGVDYSLNGDTHIRYAIIAHRGKWDKAKIETETDRWNEPLICHFYDQTAWEDMSMLNLGGTGYKISAAIAEKDGYTLRLFNTSGDNSTHNLTLSQQITHIEETDLNGKKLNCPRQKAKKQGTMFSVNMQRFSLKNYHIKYTSQ